MVLVFQLIFCFLFFLSLSSFLSITMFLRLNRPFVRKKSSKTGFGDDNTRKIYASCGVIIFFHQLALRAISYIALWLMKLFLRISDWMISSFLINCLIICLFLPNLGILWVENMVFYGEVNKKDFTLFFFFHH